MDTLPSSTHVTLTASRFKATCLSIFDRLARHELQQVVITKRGQPVAVLTPPHHKQTAFESMYGCMANQTHIPESLDLTAPILEEPFSTITVDDVFGR